MVTIVLFKDGTFQFFATEQDKKNFQSSARFFEVKDDYQVIDICEWIGLGYQKDRVKEI